MGDQPRGKASGNASPDLDDAEDDALFLHDDESEDGLLDASTPTRAAGAAGWRAYIPTRRVFATLLLGQVVSIFITGTGVSSQFLASDFGVNIPTAQSWWNYMLLLLVYGSWALYHDRRSFAAAFRQRWWKFALLALLDVEANFLVVLAYQYTNLTSIMIIDSFAIPTVMVLSHFVLKMRFKLQHIIAVFMCLAGLILLVVSDLLADGGSDEASNALKGDLFCFMGAFLYGVANVWQEILVKQQGRMEYLSMIGIFGTVISGTQVAIFERAALAAIVWNWQIVLLLFSFAFCMFSVYSLGPIILARASATLFNLSLLTSDFYGLMAGLLIFSLDINPLYYGAFVIVILGLILYEHSPPQQEIQRGERRLLDDSINDDEDDDSLIFGSEQDDEIFQV